MARRKNLTVKEALDRGRWMKGLERIASEELLDQFVKLWELLQHIVLSVVPDSIRWRFSAATSYKA